MEFLVRIKIFFEQLDERQFQRYIALFFALLFLLSGIIFYTYWSKISTLKTRAVFINRKRKEIKEILERYEIVKKQQAEVDTMLAKDRDFKIAGYFNDVITKLNLVQHKTREPETSRDTLDNGYTEVKLYASFSNLSTQNVVEMLDALEQNERIYTKELEMYKPNSNKTINVNILIATLEPKPQAEQPETE
jgi:hypothetical protein